MRLSEQTRRSKGAEIEHLGHNIRFLDVIAARSWDRDDPNYEFLWRSASHTIQESMNHITDIGAAELKAADYRPHSDQQIETLEEMDRRRLVSEDLGRNLIAFWRLRDTLNHASLTVSPDQVRELIAPASDVFAQFLAELQ